MNSKRLNLKEEFREMKKYQVLYLMLVPAIIFFILFSYVPMAGIVLAFKDYNIKLGIFKSPFAGLKYFKLVFEDPYFYLTLKNTLIISFAKLIFAFPFPIIFALMLNELKSSKFAKVVQTATYLPHFMSWVILGGIFFSFLSLDGPINAIRQLFGLNPLLFLGDKATFRQVVVITNIWKTFGWSAIIYLAAISGIDPSFNEAARLDGATRFQINWHVTIPVIMPVICITLILSMATILDAGFDQIFNLYNKAVYDVGDIIDTYVYRRGLTGMQYSYATAIGLFKSFVGLFMVVSVNWFAKKLGGEENGLW